jgi:Raf kinase inhibitor-like YbhB/YbcL family protein
MRPRCQHPASPTLRARAWRAIPATALFIVAHAFAQTGANASAAGASSPSTPFELRSVALHPNQVVSDAQVYNKEGCTGENHSPELSWRNAPPDTRGFAVTVFDPDAPGRGWWHWAVAGIPPTVNHLPANASASGYLKSIGAIEARNDFGDDGYGGPCPPPGKAHRYIVTVWALRTQDLRLASGRPAAMFEHEISVAALAAARIIVTYQR